jgi:hypothetical protein
VFRTVASTPGFNAASHTSTPLSVMRRSPSISICRAEYSMSDTRLMSSTNTRGWYFATRAWICCPTSCALTKKQPPFRAQDQQAFEGLVVAVFGRQRSQHVLATLAADDVHARVARTGWPGRPSTR